MHSTMHVIGQMSQTQFLTYADLCHTVRQEPWTPLYLPLTPLILRTLCSGTHYHQTATIPTRATPDPATRVSRH